MWYMTITGFLYDTKHIVPGYLSVVFTMSEIKLLSILRITCEVISEPHENSKFEDM